MKKKKWKMANSIQRHHLIYECAAEEVSKQGRVTIIQPEETAYIFGKEHNILTRLNRYRHVSKGFIKGLKLYITLNEDRAIRLTKKDWRKERSTKENVITKKALEALKVRI